MIEPGVRERVAKCAAEQVPCVLAIEVLADLPLPKSLVGRAKIERLLALKDRFRAAKDRVLTLLDQPSVLDVEDLAASPMMLVKAEPSAWERWLAPSRALAACSDVRVLPEQHFVTLGVRARRAGYMGPTEDQARAARDKLLAAIRVEDPPPAWFTGGVGITLDPTGGHAVCLGVRSKGDAAKFPDPFFVDGVRVMVNAVGVIRAQSATASAAASERGSSTPGWRVPFPADGWRVPFPAAAARPLPDDPDAYVAEMDRMKARAAAGNVDAQMQDASHCRRCGTYAWHGGAQTPVFDHETESWHHPACRYVHRVGYWRSASRPHLPDPRTMIDRSWSPAERELVARYLDGNEEIATYRGCSPCRCCGASNGNAERSDGTYVWPSGFSHYLRVHGVKPTAAFVRYVLDRVARTNGGVTTAGVHARVPRRAPPTR